MKEQAYLIHPSTAVRTKEGISSQDIYLFHEGTHYNAYHFMGAHLAKENGEEGVRFTVWAPHALHVGIAADMNDWNGQNHSLYKIPESGLWSRFFAGINEGTFYKYDITSPDGERFLKADPFAVRSELRPATASIVASLDGYTWSDAAWRRKKWKPYSKPVNIYEIHLGTWRQKKDSSFYTYREIAALLIPYVLEMGYTHIEIMPLSEHPYDLSWGYQLTGYFSVTSRYGCPQDFMYLVDQCHQAGIGVILDWVPAHFAKDAHGLRLFDGTPLFEYADPLTAEKPGWGTLTFDFGKPEVCSFLISNALFWMDVYHIDGLRIDAVTSMLRLDFEKDEGQFNRNAKGGIENEEAITFLRQLNETIFNYSPHVLMMAEESNAWPGVTRMTGEGGLGFNYKWNMGWMNDTLKYMETAFSERPLRHNLLTFPICYTYSENFALPLSHDEVVHGKKSLLDKMPGSYEQKFAGLRLLLGYQMTTPGKKLLFMGGEFGQFIEWKDQEALDWFLLSYDSHRKMQRYTAALNHLYLQEKALWEQDHTWEGYQWISPNDDAQSIISFVRKGKRGNALFVVINFQPEERRHYRIGVERPGSYMEIFNSDADEFGGSNSMHTAALRTVKIPWHGQKYSLELTLPPLSIVILKKTTARHTAAALQTATTSQSTTVEKSVKEKTAVRSRKGTPS